MIITKLLLPQKCPNKHPLHSAYAVDLHIKPMGVLHSFSIKNI